MAKYDAIYEGRVPSSMCKKLKIKNHDMAYHNIRYYLKRFMSDISQRVYKYIKQ